MELRVYTPELLKDCSREELEKKLDMVKTNQDLTQEEIGLNVAEIEFFLNGGVRKPNKKVINDILDGQSDISDMGGF